jgi:MFS family permease
MTAIDLFQIYLPLYGHSLSLSATVIGLIMGACAVASFAVRVTLPMLVRRYTEEPVLLFSLVLAAGAFSLIPLFSHALLLGAVSFGLGLGLGLGQPLTLVITSNLSPPGRFGEALGMRLTVNNLTHVIMPMVFGMLGSALGLAWVFWISAAFVALGGYFSRKRN